jgi:glucose/arabinose dehydrogenase
LTFSSTVITLPASPGPNHDGGVIVFGPPGAAPADQKLYIVIGDLNRNNQFENYTAGSAPDDSGCILRINADGTTPSGGDAGPFYSVPGANASLQRTYAYGVRNSFGMGFDPVTDTLWNTENGPSQYDEVNRVDPAFNSGWEYVMGPNSRSFFPGAPSLVQFGGLGTYHDPQFSWNSTVAPTAIHFLTAGGLGSSYVNDCFVADNNNGNLYHFDLNPGRTDFVLTGNLADLVFDPGDDSAQIVLGQGFGAITDLDTGPDGNLYVTSIGASEIYRIRNPSASIPMSEWMMYE